MTRLKPPRQSLILLKILNIAHLFFKKESLCLMHGFFLLLFVLLFSLFVLGPSIYILLSTGLFYISTLNISRTATPNLINHFLKELNKTFQVPNLTILNKVEACNFIRKETLTETFSCELCKFFYGTSANGCF